MGTKRTEIGGTLAFESVKFETGTNMASFEFIEHSPAHGYRDSETSISIDQAIAEKLVLALREHFGF